MLKIVLLNSGGALDAKTAKTAAEAAKAAIDMIKEAGELYDGDKIVVDGDEED